MARQLRAFRKFKKLLKVNNIPCDTYARSCVYRLYVYSVVLELHDDYFRAWKLPLTGYTFLFKANTVEELIYKLYQRKLMTYKAFDILTNNTLYYMRNQRRSYVNGVLTYWVIKDIYYNNLMERTIKVERNDGLVKHYKYTSFYVLFTTRPKYKRVIQAKLF